MIDPLASGTGLLKSLKFRVFILLTLALLPIGYISILQTRSIDEEARLNAQLTLLAITRQAATDERLIIEKAIGAAEILATLAPSLIDRPEACQDYLTAVIKKEPRFSLIGLLPVSGLMTCSTSDQTFDFSKYEEFETRMKGTSASVSVNIAAPLGGKSVILIAHPYNNGGEFAGFVSISIPHEGLITPSPDLEGFGLQELVTFSADGAVLSSRGDMATLSQRFPITDTLDQYTSGTVQTFFAEDDNGSEHIFVVAPIEQTSLFALSIWDANSLSLNPTVAWFSRFLLPASLWIAGLGLAYFVGNKLVSRPIQELQRQMRIFAVERKIVAPDASVPSSDELTEISGTFEKMASKIVTDEARMKDVVDQKNVLIKEIHHRVKNNLQLISSIISLQTRNTSISDTIRDLERVRERVLDLATIHNNIDEPEGSDTIRSGPMIHEVLASSGKLSQFKSRDEFQENLDIDDIALPIDLAIPLALFVGELSSQAAYAIEKSDHARHTYELSWKKIHDDGCQLVQRMSAAQQSSQVAEVYGTQLLDAFAAQMEATLDVSTQEEFQTITLTFHPGGPH